MNISHGILPFISFCGLLLLEVFSGNFGCERPEISLRYFSRNTQNSFQLPCRKLSISDSDKQFGSLCLDFPRVFLGIHWNLFRDILARRFQMFQICFIGFKALLEVFFEV